MLDERLLPIAENQPYPLLFATVSGAHLYGFPSANSDWDLRGVHILPVEAVVGLITGKETVETSRLDGGLDLDLVTHDMLKFARLMLNRNGYVLEQLFSPLVVLTSDAHHELVELGRGCITRHHVHHYLGFFNNQWKLLQKEDPSRLKPLLYCFRVLLTGIHLMQTGVVESNLTILAPEARLGYLDELIARKRDGIEDETVTAAEAARVERDLRRLETHLAELGRSTDLPDEASAGSALNDFVVRQRLRSCHSAGLTTPVR